jgi:CRP/FNR family transcriptional regulator
VSAAAEGIAAILERTMLFAGLVPADLEALAAIARVRSYGRRAEIFAEGEPGDGLYIVFSGRVKIYKLSSEGKEQILHIFGPGEPFGEVPMFAGRNFPAHAMTLEPAELLFLPRRQFIDLITAHPSLALNLLAVLSGRLRQFTVLIDDLSLKEVPGRLAAYLLYLSDRQAAADRVVLEITKTQLAGLLGTIPETLSRLLARLSRDGLIALDGPAIVIRDRPALEEVAAAGRLLPD